MFQIRIRIWVPKTTAFCKLVGLYGVDLEDEQENECETTFVNDGPNWLSLRSVLVCPWQLVTIVVY